MVTEQNERRYDTEHTGSNDEELIEGPFKRAFMVLVSPRRTYESLKAKRSRMDWIVPLAITILCSLIMLNAGFSYLMEEQRVQQINRIRNMEQLSEGQRDEQITRINESLSGDNTSTQIISNVSGGLGAIASVAFIALVLMGVSRLALSSSLSFGDSFTITALAGMVSAAGIIIMMPLMFLYESFQRAQITLGLLFPESMSETFIARLFDVSLFSILYLLLLSTGLSVFTKKSFTGSMTPLLVLWIVYRVVTVGVTGMLGLG